MVQGIKFLTKKSFNPTNLNNQKQVWEREQQKKIQQQKIEERNKVLQQEKDNEMIAISRGQHSSHSYQMKFMYEPPPGLNASSSSTTTTTKTTNPLESKPEASNAVSTADRAGASSPSVSTSTLLATERQPGDDDAVAAFRQLLAASTSSSSAVAVSSSSSNTNTNRLHLVDPTFAVQHSSRGTVLQGTSYNPNDVNNINSHNSKIPAVNAASQLTALEKAAGKKPQHAMSSIRNKALSYEEQVQRFPLLANAPRVQGIINNSNTSENDGIGNQQQQQQQQLITFKPFGAQIRQIKCLACGIWGHSKGDRECSISGWDPFAITTSSTTAAVGVAATSNSANKATTKELDDRKPARGEHSIERPHSNHHGRARVDDTNISGTSSISSRSSYSDDSITQSSRDDHRRRKRRKHSSSSNNNEKKHSKKKKHSRHRRYRDDDDDDDSRRERKRHKKKRRRHDDK